ncbi:MAG: transposase [candidate division Zixibacteria bacterium]|nr:transposase [candidate division Zixibacteria bacterium]
MSKLLRYYGSGQLYFVTAVTYDRLAILAEHADLFWESIDKIREKAEFDLIAWIIMPDHFHAVIDFKESSLAEIMKRVKISFAFLYRERLHLYRGRTWQNRYWDHVIRDQEDWNHHVDYIHYNPVKHRMAKSPFAWKESSIHKYFAEGYYSKDWGNLDIIEYESEYGE